MGWMNLNYFFYGWLFKYGIQDDDFQWYFDNLIKLDVIGVNYYFQVFIVKYVVGDLYDGLLYDLLLF